MIKLWENGAPLFDETIGQEEPSITPYLIESDKPVGCVIVFPGGAYLGRAGHEGEPIAKMLNDAGFHAFVLNYRVAPYHYPVMLYDEQRAIRYVRYHAKEFNIDPEKIGVLGFSAGGHLAVMAMQQYDLGLSEGDEIDRVSCRPDAAVLCYPVVSLLKEGHGHMGSAGYLLGDQGHLAKSLSGEYNVKENDPPVFIWHTSDDEGVHVANSLNLGVALREKGIQFEMHIYPHGHHGLGLAKSDPVVSRWTRELCDWLKRLGF